MFACSTMMMHGTVQHAHTHPLCVSIQPIGARMPTSPSVDSRSQMEEDRKNAADKTLEAYKAAQDKAVSELPSTNPIRLGLALNFSVFYYEVLNQPEQACSLAKQVRAYSHQSCTPGQLLPRLACMGLTMQTHVLVRQQ